MAEACVGARGTHSLSVSPLRTLRGHKEVVTSVAFDNSGKLLASGSADQTVGLWDADSARQLHVLKGHKDAVQSVSFGKGSLLVSASDDSTVCVWDAARASVLRTLTEHTYAVQSVAHSSNASLLASGSIDLTVRVWGTSAWRTLRLLHTHSSVFSASFSKDGRLLAAGCINGVVLVWDLRTWRLLRELNTHKERCWCVSFGAGAQLVSTGGRGDREVAVWDAARGELVHTLRGHSRSVWSAAISAQGVLCSGSYDDTVKLWDPTDGAHLLTHTVCPFGVKSVGFSNDGAVLAAGCSDGEVHTLRVSAAAGLVRRSEELLRHNTGRSAAVLSSSTAAHAQNTRGGSTETERRGEKGKELEEGRRQWESDRKRREEDTRRTEEFEKERTQWETERKRKEAEDRRRAETLEEQLRNLEIARKRKEAEDRRRAEALEEQLRNLEIARKRKEAEDRRRAETLEEQLRNLEIARKRKQSSDFELRMTDIDVGEKLVGGEDGAFGVVFEGRLHGVAAVAVKKIRLEGFGEDEHPEEDFDHEVAQMRTALHPNVAILMGVVRQPPEYWMVVELCENGSLFDVLHRRRVRLEPQQKCKLLVDVAKGMTYLHARKLVHRDIKSGNVFITGDWVAKVGDFGCSKTRAHSRASMKSVVGTSCYMAPEIMDRKSAKDYTEKVDVYSFGILMWELFEEKVPFHGWSEAEVIIAVFVRQERPEFEKTHDVYRRLIARCWAHVPAERPSFQEVLDELLRVFDGLLRPH